MDAHFQEYLAAIAGLSELPGRGEHDATDGRNRSLSHPSPADTRSSRQSRTIQAANAAHLGSSRRPSGLPGTPRVRTVVAHAVHHTSGT